MPPLLIALSAVLSLVTIISIYREGGILKRLRATPLRPYTILGAHVLVKLLLTAITLALMVVAGQRYYPADLAGGGLMFGLALLVATTSLLPIGFLIASVVPTARLAQPLGSLLLYPMLASRDFSLPSSRCRRYCGPFPVSCRSPMRSRCCAAFGRENRGSATSVMSPR